MPPWLKPSYTTDITADWEPVTSAVMMQPLGAGTVECAGFLLYPEHNVDWSFEEHADKLCVPRQLANVINVSINLAILCIPTTSDFQDYFECI